MSTSCTACACSWEVLALPAFSLPLPTGIRLLGSKILPAIFKVLSEPTRLPLPVTDPSVRIFSCFFSLCSKPGWQQPGFPPHSHPELDPGQGPGFSSGGSRGIWCPSRGIYWGKWSAGIFGRGVGMEGWDLCQAWHGRKTASFGIDCAHGPSWKEVGSTLPALW